MRFLEIEESLRASPKRWLVTGVAGFIGSNLLEALLSRDQIVVGIDNFATGHRSNLEDVERQVGAERFRSNFTFHEASITSAEACQKVCEGIDIVLHQGALGSVPRSIENPPLSNDANVNGFVQLATASKNAGIKRFVYASSSSVYGDCQDHKKVEHSIGNLLSPYAVTKRVNELYAEVFSKLYGMEMVGLRYFNVFGPRQDPNGAYAAVIPRWIGRLLSAEPCTLFGDGTTSRDFCYIRNVVQANILSGAVESSPELLGAVFNVAVGETTSLLKLYEMIVDSLSSHLPNFHAPELRQEEFRKGDIKRSLAEVGKISRVLGYTPTHTLAEGMKETAAWYVKNTATRA